MDPSTNDCYYFYYSTCTKGSSCPFRHCEMALGKEAVCSLWREGHCYRTACPYRHMEVNKDRSTIACFWEDKPGGCKKPHCPFRHKLQQDYTNLSLEEIIQPVGIKGTVMPPPSSKYHCSHLNTKANLDSEKAGAAVQTPTIDPVVVKPIDSEDESSIEGSPVAKSSLSSTQRVLSPNQHQIRHLNTLTSPIKHPRLETSNKEGKCNVIMEALMRPGEVKSGVTSLQNLEEMQRKRALKSLQIRRKGVMDEAGDNQLKKDEIETEDKNGTQLKTKRLAKPVYEVKNRLSDKFKQAGSNNEVIAQGENNLPRSQSIRTFKEQMKEKQLKKQQEIEKQLQNQLALDFVPVESSVSTTNSTKKLSNKLTWREKMKENQLKKQEEIQQLLLLEEKKEIEVIKKVEKFEESKEKPKTGGKLSWREAMKQKQIALQEKIKKDIADGKSKTADAPQMSTVIVKRKLPLSNSQGPSVKIARARPNPRLPIIPQPAADKLPVAGKILSQENENTLLHSKPKSFVEVRKEKRLKELQQLKEQGLIDRVDEKMITGQKTVQGPKETASKIIESKEMEICKRIEVKPITIDSLKINTNQIQIEKSTEKQDKGNIGTENNVSTSEARNEKETSKKPVVIKRIMGVVPSSTDAPTTRPKLKRKPARPLDKSPVEKEIKLTRPDSTTQPASQEVGEPINQQEKESQTISPQVEDQTPTTETNQLDSTEHETESSLQEQDVPKFKEPLSIQAQPEVATPSEDVSTNPTTSDVVCSSTDGSLPVHVGMVKPNHRIGTGRRNSRRKSSTDQFSSFDYDDDDFETTNVQCDGDEVADVGDDALLKEIDELLND